MSSERGTKPKVYDQGPAALTSNFNFDGSGSPTTNWVTGVIGETSLNPPWLTQLPQSVNDNGRVGQQIAVESFDLKIVITPDNTLVGHGFLRMIVFCDNECDGAYPAINDLLGDTTDPSSTVAQGLPLLRLNPAYFGRFKVLEDKQWTWYNSSTANSFQDSANNHNFYHERFHDMKGHRIMWDMSDASAITNARNGHIFMYFIFYNTTTAAGGLPTVTTTNPPSIQYSSRIRFRDQ